MARTLIGRLQLIVQAIGLSEAKKVEGTISSIEKAANRLTTAKWGQGFQRQIEKMALSAKDLDTVRRSWDRLQTDMASRNLSKTMRKSDISAWKTSTLSHFASIRAGMRETEREAVRFGRRVQNALRPAYVMLGGYTGVYMAGVMGREAFGASSERQREIFRQRMADIPEDEQNTIYNKSQALSAKYPSASITDIMQMARTARNTMGSTERGMQILDKMVQGFVTLQSAKGVDAAVSSLSGLLKGLDNLGTNSDGIKGVNNVNNLVDAFIRAAQIEGDDFDVRSVWEFARRSRIAGPGLSPKFLATVAPAMIQDMGAGGAGTALAMAYKSFVVGANDVASKVNMEEQRRVGIRTGKGKGSLVGADLFGTNPYEWVKKYLIPAIQKDGVDINDNTQVALAIAKLSRNSSATGLLTRMISQMPQYERLGALYDRGMGTDAADQAAGSDPFVAFKGLQESLRNLSAAVGDTVMPVIIPALNSLSGTINSFAEMVMNGDPRVMTGATAAGVGLAGFATYKIGAGIYGLITAGTQLNIAAAALQAAAVAQGGGAAGGVAAGLAGKGFFKTLLTTPWGIAALIAGGGIYKFIADTTASNAKDSKAPPPKYYSQGDTQDRDNYHRLYGGMQFEGGWHRVGMGAAPAPGVDAANQAGAAMKDALSVKATPQVDTSSINNAIEAAKLLLHTLMQAGSAASNAKSAVDSQARRALTDYGVAP